MATQQTSPPFAIPLVDQQGNTSQPWLQFFQSLFARSGGSSGGISGQLDGITTVPGSTLFRGSSAWTALGIGATSSVLQVSGGFPAWGFLSGANFPVQAANNIFAGPTSGGSVVPAFRTLVPADLTSLAGQYPGVTINTNALAGNIGEYISATVTSGAPVALTTTVIANVTSITLNPGDWDVWANIGVSVAPTSAKAWISTLSATDPGSPNSGAYLSGASFPLAGPIGTIRLLLSAPTTVYLSINATFAGGLSAFGFLGARRTH